MCERRDKVMEDHAHTVYRLYEELSFQESGHETKRTMVKNFADCCIQTRLCMVWLVFLTLGAHARKGCSTSFVCLSVCMSVCMSVCLLQLAWLTLWLNL